MTNNSDANAEVHNTMTTTARQLQLQHLRILAEFSSSPLVMTSDRSQRRLEFLG